MPTVHPIPTLDVSTTLITRSTTPAAVIEVSNHTVIVERFCGSADPMHTLSEIISCRVDKKEPNNHRLPFEVWANIFSFATLSHANTFDTPNTALWRGRLTMAAILAVCYAWRSAALGTQELWSQIVLPSGSKHLAQCLKMHLRYSRKAPLDIFFFRPPGHTYTSLRQLRKEHIKLARILARPSVLSRIRVIENMPIASHRLGHNVDHHVNFAELLRRHGRQLESVGIRPWEGRRDAIDSWDGALLRDTIAALKLLPTSVRELSYQPTQELMADWKCLFTTSSPRLETFWAKLTRINIIGSSTVHFTFVNLALSKCTRLEKAHFSRVSGTGWETEQQSTFGPLYGNDRGSAPRLRQLVIPNYEGDASVLLDGFSFPSLEALAIKQNEIIQDGQQARKASRWVEFLERTRAGAASRKGGLKEVWLHGLGAETVDRILWNPLTQYIPSVALTHTKSIFSIIPTGIRRRPCLFVRSAPEPTFPHFLDAEGVYMKVAYGCGMSLEVFRQKYIEIPWYGWHKSSEPLRLASFVAHAEGSAPVMTEHEPIVAELD